MQQKATLNTREINSWDVSQNQITDLRLFIPIYVYIFHRTDQVPTLRYNKIAIYFHMSLMVEPNIVSLAQHLAIFGKMVASSKKYLQEC